MPASCAIFPAEMHTIATFTMPEEAHLLRMRLEDVGIQACVLDEHVVQLNHFYSNAIGGVRVQVSDHAVDEARAFLEADAALASTERGADDPELNVLLKRERWRHAIGWLSAIVLGFPLLLFGARTGSRRSVR